MKEKVAVLGAGAAGLFAAHKLKELGHPVDLFESHTKSGGCASFFKRKIDEKLLRFDAGATVLWELQDNQLLSSLLKKWNVKFPPFHKHNKHFYTVGSKSFFLDAQNESTWIASLKENFPQDILFIDKFFPEFFDISRNLNQILFSIPAEPFLKLDAIFHNLKFSKNLLKIFPYLIKYPRSFNQFLAKHNVSNELQKWIDMTLLITLQAKSDEVETLYAAASLCFYPLGAGALEGGMASLFEALASNFPSSNTQLLYAHKVVKINYDQNSQTPYSLKVINKTEEKIFGPYAKIFTSTPRWNTQELFDERVFASIPKWEKSRGHLWSAVVAYLIIEDNGSLPEEAFNHQANDIYFSVCKKGDEYRGLEKDSSLRIITASTHTRLKDWESFPDYIKAQDFKNKDKYIAVKNEFEGIFSKAAMHSFKDCPLKFIEVATPKSFLHYTGRKEGFVGGIPLTREHSFLKSPSQQTILPHLYQIGDTSFPGQSVVSCAVGALEAVRKSLRF